MLNLILKDMKIYEPTGKAREYSPLALNYYNGCTHGCLYCYVPSLLGTFNKSYNHSKMGFPDETGFLELKKSAEKLKSCNKQILLSFTGDPYCGFKPEITNRVLKLLKYYNHKVAVLTKGGKNIIPDLDLIKSFKSNIKIGATLTFINDNDSLKWEPEAKLPTERIDTLLFLSENGVKTWVSFEPVIDTVQSLQLLTEVVPFIDHVKIGKLNNYKDLDKKIDWFDFLKKATEILRKNNMNDRFYIKKDLLNFNKGIEFSKNELNQDFLNL
jgi:DNA repair photolyase